MANDKNFKIKNGLLAGRYLGSNGVETAGAVGYDLAGASYDSNSFSTASQDTFPADVFFKSDGTKVYLLGATNDSVYQYSLSTPWDISTAAYDSASFSVNSQDADAYSLYFKSDGTKFYVSGYNSNSIFQYSLSAAWDISTASYDNVSFSFASQENQITGSTFKSDGTKVYAVGITNDTIYQYSLSTAWDLSTASYESISFSVGPQEGFPYSLVFNTEGNKLYLTGGAGQDVNYYTLSTAWNVSSASFNSLFSVNSQDTAPYGIRFKSDGTKMYIVGRTGQSIYQYSTALLTQTLDLSTGNTFSFTPSGATTVSFTNAPASGTATGFSVEIVGDGSALTWPSSIKWNLGTAPVATASKELYAFVTTDGGTTYYGKLAAGDIA